MPCRPSGRLRWPRRAMRGASCAIAAAPTPTIGPPLQQPRHPGGFLQIGPQRRCHRYERQRRGPGGRAVLH
eukprot:5273201-Lingulodinium_polyedra.AAC.1